MVCKYNVVVDKELIGAHKYSGWSAISWQNTKNIARLGRRVLKKNAPDG